MSLLVAVLLVSAQATADAQLPAPAPATSSASKKKEKKICKTDDAESGSHMVKRTCRTEQEWEQRGQGMVDNSRSGFSGKAQDH